METDRRTEREDGEEGEGGREAGTSENPVHLQPSADSLAVSNSIAANSSHWIASPLPINRTGHC